MNADQFKGSWKQLRGRIREKWGELTDDDLDMIGGKLEQLVGRIQQKYGLAREAAEREVNSWLAQAEPELHPGS